MNDIYTFIQRLSDNIDLLDERLSDNIDSLDERLSKKIDSLDAALFNTRRKIDENSTEQNDKEN